MARGRMLSKSLSTSEKYAALGSVAGPLAEFCQALFPLLIAHADDFGRLQGDPFTVKHMAYPASPRRLDEFAEGLRFLHATKLVIWYTVDSKQFLQITQYEPHQIGLHKRTRSHYPRVPGNSGNFPEVPSQLNRRELNRTELNRTEGKGTEGKGTLTQRPAAPAAMRAARDGREDRDRFECFWEAFPKKSGKDAAWRVWRQHRPSAELLAAMVAALDWQRRQPNWVCEGGRFVPSPANWLTRGQWQDEPTPAPLQREEGKLTARLTAAMRNIAAETNREDS